MSKQNNWGERARGVKAFGADGDCKYSALPGGVQQPQRVARPRYYFECQGEELPGT
jgi:hypothetical protein